MYVVNLLFGGFLLIRLKNLSKIYNTSSGQLTALDNIQLDIHTHECYGVIGESGAGKSTLLRMINALEVPTSGSILVDDTNIHSLSKKELNLFKKNIGMVFQQFNLLNNLTVQENILLPLKLHAHDDTLDIDHVLEFVGLTNKKDAYPSQLSGGQKQRVGIARALISKPRILLCDEPTSALDESTTDEIIQLLKRVNKTFNMTILIVTHELNVVKQLCDRAAIMDNGKITDIISVDKEDSPLSNMSYHDRALEVLTSTRY